MSGPEASRTGHPPAAKRLVDGDHQTVKWAAVTSGLLRADARRSRHRLMEAGATLFVEQGFGVQVSAIAERAGVAKGTFFRHFPTKRELVIALLVELLQDLGALAVSYAEQRPDDAVAGYMAMAAERLLPLRRVIETAVLSGLRSELLREARAELMVQITPLVEVAIGRGEIRGDVTAFDVFMVLLSSTGTAYDPVLSDEHPTLWRRYLALGINGLRPDDGAWLPPMTPIAAVAG